LVVVVNGRVVSATNPYASFSGYISHLRPLNDVVDLPNKPCAALRIAQSLAECNHNHHQILLNNAYLHIDKPIIIDKNRRWPVLIDLIKETSNIPIKIIAPVRNITDIVSSFLTLADATEDNYVKKELNKNKLPYTKQNACKCIADTLIRDRYIALKTAFYKHKECFLFLEYNDIVNNPNTTIKKVYNFLDLPSYKHDYSNLVNMEPEKDAEVNGFANLHTIRPMLAKKSKPVIENIGKDMFEYFTSLKLEFWKEDITIKT